MPGVGHTVRRAPPPSIAPLHVGAPLGGVNALASLSDLPPGDCAQRINLIVAGGGLKVRPGYRNWAVADFLGLGAAATYHHITAMLPFNGATRNGAGDRLFASVEDGLYDYSAAGDVNSGIAGFPGTAITKALDFPLKTGDAGWGISHAFQTVAGHFLLHCDEENGLFIYSETSATWTQVTQGSDAASQISGVDPARFVFVTVFDGRVWFVEKDSARAWYLDAGSIYGTAHEFDFGRQFPRGGSLVGLWNWTQSGGDGMNQQLVAVSTGGDAVVYQGTDPSDADTFGLRGSWYIGGVPAGRTLATNYGGDMLLLSTLGVIPMSALVAGQSALAAGQYFTAKVAPIFNALVAASKSKRGWALRINPADNTLIIVTPTAMPDFNGYTGIPGSASIQLAVSLANGSWSVYSGLPIVCAEPWNGKLYMGGLLGASYVLDGVTDGTQFPGYVGAEAGTPIQYGLITGFYNGGNARQKQVQMIRPNIRSGDATPSFSVEARYRYDLHAMADVSVATGTEGFGTEVFGTATFQEPYATSQQVRGAAGLGTEFAIAMKGAANTETFIEGFDVVFTEGGVL